MYEIHITETARNSLKEEAHSFNSFRRELPDIDSVKGALIDMYGKLPKGRQKVYIDTLSGETQEVGFLHSFWNRDVSHNSKSWYQTDWISIYEVTRKPVKII
ncbi:MAG: hypothetical protein EHM49_00330 [Deltaproteobacteria bacterium]|nr:MAG: hypothetical protein EHM49_00330 [Deltaproteobacteria bacterium]